MAWTQADLQVLRAAYAGGTLTVRFADGRQVTYPSGDDLLKRIREIERQMENDAGRPRPRTGFVRFGRG